MEPARSKGYDDSGHTSMRHTIYVPDEKEQLIRSAMQPGETFSAAVLRLVQEGIFASMGREEPGYFNSMEGDDLPEDLGLNYEKYMHEPTDLFERWLRKRSEER